MDIEIAKPFKTGGHAFKEYNGDIDRFARTFKKCESCTIQHITAAPLIPKYTYAELEMLYESIRDTFNKQCFLCGKTENDNNRKLDIHHINYIRMDMSISNLIPLCRSCHSRTNWNKEHWQKTIKEKQQIP